MSAQDVLAKVPIVGSLFDNSQEKAIEQVRKNQKLWETVLPPTLTWDEFAPEAHEYGGDFNPEAIDYQQISEDPITRSAQMSALQKMAGLADTGLSEVDELGFARAEREGNRLAQGSTQAAISDARRRGVSGGGLEFAMREIGSQAAAERAQDAALETAAQAAQQRALYNQAYLSGTGAMRDQDYRANAANTGIINQFNQANTGARNQAAQQNLGRREAIANTNVNQRNQAQQYNQSGRRETQQQNFNNEVARMGGMTGANTSVANAYGAVNAANQADRNANTDLLAKSIGFAFDEKDEK